MRMRARSKIILPWALWLLAVTELGVTPLMGSLDDTGDAGGLAVLIALTVFVVAFATVGALVASRRGTNPIGWLMLASSLAFATAALALTASELLAQDGVEFLARWIGWMSTWLWVVGAGLPGTFLLLLFPTGRPPSRRWKPILLLAGLSIAMVVLQIALRPGPLDLDGGVRLTNPLGLNNAGILDVIGGLGGIGLMLAHAAAITSLIARFRAGRTEQRQQLKWLLYGGLLPMVALAGSLALDRWADLAVDLSNAMTTAGLTAVPVTIGIAILRHRLYDIDIVINRTLVYGLLTTMLAGSYLLIVVALQAVLPTQGNQLAVAGSTLTVAALFGPLRRRIQSFIDRRFYRARYDAEQTLTRFSTRLKDQVDLDALTADLIDVVGETLRPAHAHLWLREGSGA